MMTQQDKVLVVMGGISAEREVSLATGKACIEALDTLGLAYGCYDFTGNVSELIATLGSGYTVMLNALHGTYGEDGRIQAIGDLMQIPYSHSGVLASALAMNKAASLQIFQANGLPIAESVCLDHAAIGECTDWPLPLPLVVKPIAEGSSIGVIIYRDGEDFAEHQAAILKEAERGALLFEEYIPGQELTVSVIDDARAIQALGVTELFTGEDFYDYTAKYSTVSGATHVCPAEIPTALRDELMQAACTAHKILSLCGVSRSDFRHDPAQNRWVILETNTQPGMTQTSLLPEQAAQFGWSFPELIQKILIAARYD